jgi:hypothetical protein
MKARSLLKLVSAALLAGAIAQELKKPADERTWHGHVAGFVPYDFRPPTLDRLRRAYWNPGDSKILTERVFGVGWAVNVGRLVRLAKERVA